ncbi:MAG: thioredoxin domain-containing protein [Oceanospirillaceae bacterium]|nr:thioredoxin domain-containing protein [Oceanospirillaceae bacterium]MCP5349760.1 thioredoxin domain-containing protein [Oceanospirillaceae bacterium]
MRSICLIFLLFIAACSEQQAPVDLAVQGNNALRTADFANVDKIALYELHWQEYLTLRGVLQNWVTTQNAAPVRSSLQMPDAPLIEYAAKADWQIGDDNSAVTIQLFCTLVSEPCKRVYQELLQYMPYVQGGMQIQFYETWRAFHKFALPVATALACVPEVNRADLRQFILAQNNMDAERLDASPVLLGFNAPAFNQCRQSETLRNSLLQQQTTLENAGLAKPPVLLINKRYIAQADWERLFAYLQPYLAAPVTAENLPGLSVKHIYPVQPVGLSFADVEFQGQKIRWSLNQCQAGLCLQTIAGGKLIFFRDGRFYSPGQAAQPVVDTAHDTGSISVGADTEFSTDFTAQQAAQQEQPQKELADDDHAGRVRELLTSIPPSPLSRTWLDEQLNRQAELEKNFITTDMEVEGQHLLKLKPGDTDAFYAQLGMQAGDVIMRINDEWVHDGYNSLWENLRSAQRLEISLMRHGLPVHLVYAVQEP